MNSYDQGEPARIPFTVKNNAGALADPTTILFGYQLPGNDPVYWEWPSGAQIIHDSTGTFHAVIDTTPSGGGIANVFIRTTGVVTSGRWQFAVTTPPFPMS